MSASNPLLDWAVLSVVAKLKPGSHPWFCTCSYGAITLSLCAFFRPEISNHYRIFCHQLHGLSSRLCCQRSSPGHLSKDGSLFWSQENMRSVEMKRWKLMDVILFPLLCVCSSGSGFALTRPTPHIRCCNCGHFTFSVKEKNRPNKGVKSTPIRTRIFQVWSALKGDLRGSFVRREDPKNTTVEVKVKLKPDLKVQDASSSKWWMKRTQRTQRVSAVGQNLV